MAHSLFRLARAPFYTGIRYKRLLAPDTLEGDTTAGTLGKCALTSQCSKSIDIIITAQPTLTVNEVLH